MKNRQKQIKGYDVVLKKHIEKRNFVKISRTFKGREENIQGFILDMTKHFLLVQIETEFFLNGYAIILKEQFDSLRCNKFDRTIKNILKGEGVFESDYGIDETVDLTSWQTIFNSLRKLDYHVIVECEDLDEPTFAIGPIKRVAKDKVSIQNYDPTGVLDDHLTSINYSKISIVQFDERYTKVFRKYLKPANK